VGEPSAIEAEGLCRSFGALTAVDGASLRVGRGELVALLGPSGSGKTTLLRMIAGFERPDAGTVRIGSRTVAARGEWVEPEQRRIGMVFQQGALFPHLDVAANVGFGPTSASAPPGASASARRWTSSGSRGGRRPTRTSSPAASASGSRWRARSRQTPR
jgi:iron(III) transport system ATP-binding protein